MALAMVMVFMFALALIGASFFAFTDSARKWSARDLWREQAFSLAEAGVELAAQNLLTNWAIPALNYQYNQAQTALGAGTFAFSIASTTNNYSYSIHATGTVGKMKRAVHIARAERPAWARYALWTDVNGVIYFFGNETFNGPVHSNDRFYFDPSGGPGARFYDDLTSANSTYGGDISGAYFAKGFQLNAQPGSMSDVNLPSMKTVAQNVGLVLTGKTSITFSGTNTFISNTRKGWTNRSYGIVGDNIIYVANSNGTGNAGTIEIGGTIDNRVTIVSEDSIWITNHIKYAVNPTNNPSSNDVLGMVAKGDIVIRTNAPNNLTLQAAMMATGQNTNFVGSFVVQNNTTRPPSGNLNMLGSIVQDTRGIVNWGGGGTTGNGYAKKYSFDVRLASNAPRYYPRVSTAIKFYGWSDEAVR